MEAIAWNRLLDIHRRSVVERTIFGAVAIASDHGPLTILGEDPQIFGRSLMKPLQMKVIAAELADELSWEEKAIALSSHNGTEAHIRAAQSILPSQHWSRLQLPSSLPLGGVVSHIVSPTGKSQWAHPCSGKHAAILKVCEVRQWSVDNYLEIEHPYNQRYIEYLERNLGVSLNNQIIARDGCGLPTVALTLSQIAQLFTLLASEREEDWVWEAAHRHPELIGGSGRLDTLIMRHHSAVFAKEGADGLLGLSIQDARFPNGLGLVIKMAHGYDMNMAWHVASPLLRELGYEIPPPPELEGQEILFSRALAQTIQRASVFSKGAFERAQ